MYRDCSMMFISKLPAELTDTLIQAPLVIWSSVALVDGCVIECLCISSRQQSLGRGESQIELPRMPWSDWEIAAEQITICKRPNGEDWELGSGAYGSVGSQISLVLTAIQALCATQVLKATLVFSASSLMGSRSEQMCLRCHHVDLVP